MREASPTQPLPVKPPPYARQSMSGTNSRRHAGNRASFAKLHGRRNARQYLTRRSALKPTGLFPGNNGGANWGGASFDPETHTLYVNSMDVGMIFRMVKRPEGRRPIPYRSGRVPESWFWDKDMYPCQKPPWAHLRPSISIPASSAGARC